MANVLKAVLRPAKMASPITLKVTEDVIIEPNVATNVEVSFDVDKASSSGIDLITNAIVEETQDKSKSLKFDSKFEGLTKKGKFPGTRRSTTYKPRIHYSSCFEREID